MSSGDRGGLPLRSTRLCPHSDYHYPEHLYSITILTIENYHLKTFITVAGEVEYPVVAGCPGMAVVSPGTVVLLPADWAALALLHDPLRLRTVQGGALRLLVAALDVAVLTPAQMAPLGTPHLAVTQCGSEIVQGSAGLCNDGLTGLLRQFKILLRHVGQQWPGAGGSGRAQAGGGQETGAQ